MASIIVYRIIGKIMEYVKISIIQLNLWIHRLKASKENRNIQSIIRCPEFWYCFISEGMRQGSIQELESL